MDPAVAMEQLRKDPSMMKTAAAMMDNMTPEQLEAMAQVHTQSELVMLFVFLNVASIWPVINIRQFGFLTLGPSLQLHAHHRTCHPRRVVSRWTRRK